MLKQAFIVIFGYFIPYLTFAQQPNESSVKWSRDTVMLRRNDDLDSVMARVSCNLYVRPRMIVLEWPAGKTQPSWLQMETYTSPRNSSGQILWGQGRFLRFPLHADPHAATPGVTYMPVFPGMDIDVINIRGSLPAGMDSLEVYLWQFGIPAIAPVTVPVTPRGNCLAPPLVPQSVWRAGLPAPKPGRTATATHHCIVHHSGSNTRDTNFTEVVRGYYIYHTTVNGWDDIGYNYLVDPRGVVYAGRDPEKAGIAQDNVLGAHFCGKNSGTMGVCVIGNYVTERPSAAAMQSLQTLLSWKIYKDGLDPFGSQRHPDAGGALLPVIAGHREGCATECPGDSLYAGLPDLRQALLPCFPAGVRHAAGLKQPVRTGQGWVIPELKQMADVHVYDMSGKLMAHTVSGPGKVIEFEGSGVYIIRVILSGGRSAEFRVYQP